MDVLDSAKKAEDHMRQAAGLLQGIHDALYGMDTGEGDEVADEFAAAQWDIEFALERLPETLARARRFLNKD
jgi:hypothetical protein